MWGTQNVELRRWPPELCRWPAHQALPVRVARRPWSTQGPSWGYLKSQFLRDLVNVWRQMPTKWLQDRTHGSKTAPGIPPHRAFCGVSCAATPLPRPSDRGTPSWSALIFFTPLQCLDTQDDGVGKNTHYGFTHHPKPYTRNPNPNP